MYLVKDSLGLVLDVRDDVTRRGVLTFTADFKRRYYRN